MITVNDMRHAMDAITADYRHETRQYMASSEPEAKVARLLFGDENVVLIGRVAED